MTVTTTRTKLADLLAVHAPAGAAHGFAAATVRQHAHSARWASTLAWHKRWAALRP